VNQTENKKKPGALIGGIIKAKIDSAILPGSILELPNPQWETICLVTPTAANLKELMEKLKSAPWEPIAFENPENWSKEYIQKTVCQQGLASIAKIVIKDRKWANNLATIPFY